MAQCSR